MKDLALVVTLLVAVGFAAALLGRRRNGQTLQQPQVRPEHFLLGRGSTPLATGPTAAELQAAFGGEINAATQNDRQIAEFRGSFGF